MSCSRPSTRDAPASISRRVTAGGHPRQHRLRRPADERRPRHEGAVGQHRRAGGRRAARPAPTWCWRAAAAWPKCESVAAVAPALAGRARWPASSAPVPYSGNSSPSRWPRRRLPAPRFCAPPPELNQCRSRAAMIHRFIHDGRRKPHGRCQRSRSAPEPPEPEPELAAPSSRPGRPPRTPSATQEALVVSLDGFEGPLDVLLALARTQKVDLAKISVLALAEQYLAVHRPGAASCGWSLPPTTW